MSKYTSGKWKCVLDKSGYGCVYSDETNIALLVHERDINLITSAPELLTACKFAKQILTSDDPEDVQAISEVISHLTEAISKTEGV